MVTVLLKIIIAIRTLLITFPNDVVNDTVLNRVARAVLKVEYVIAKNGKNLAAH
jgi:hypothetical protein